MIRCRTRTMTSAVALIFVLFVSKVERSDAVSCYTCDYMYTRVNPKEGACSEPFNATNAPTCDGPACHFLYSGTLGHQDYYSVIRDCTGFGLDSFIRKQCPPNTITNEQGNYTYFSYGSSCCQWFRSTRTDTESMICQCQTDNCNGVLPHRMPNAGDMPSTIANRISAQSTIAQRKSSDGFSPQPIGKLSIVFVAMIAVLSIIRWYI